MDKLAVIDLGSNTFHVLIVERINEPPYFKEIYKERQYIYLASEGKSIISNTKLEKAIECLTQFKATIVEHNCQEIKAVATAAIRSADNAESIIEEIRNKCGIKVELISGEREAELIHKGTLCLNRQIDQASLIMDIGGGSVEFIIQQDRKRIFSGSYNIGISFIRKAFNFSEPVTLDERELFYLFLDDELVELAQKISEIELVYLIGCSGSYEIIEAMNDDTPSPSGNVYSRSQVDLITKKVLESNKDQRLAIDKMPSMRADLSKEAFLLID